MCTGQRVVFRVLLCCARVYINCGAAAGLALLGEENETTRTEHFDLSEFLKSDVDLYQEKRQPATQAQNRNNGSFLKKFLKKKNLFRYYTVLVLDYCNTEDNGFTRALPSDV